MIFQTVQLRTLATSLTAAGAQSQGDARMLIARFASAIESDAKGLAPVDTGALRSSIITSIVDSGVSVQAEIGPTVEYGVYQELGTSTQAGTPFMGPAFDRNLPGFQTASAALGMIPT